MPQRSSFASSYFSSPSAIFLDSCRSKVRHCGTMAGHSHRAAHIGQLMETGRWDDIVRFDSAYPPLNYIFTGLLFWMFGSHADIPQFSVVFYVLLLMGTVAMMTIQLTKNKYLAIAAAALTFFYPQLRTSAEFMIWITNWLR